MATRRPIVLVSGVQSELPVGDNVDGALYQSQQIIAGSGLIGGGFFGSNPRLDVSLISNPSGLYFSADSKLGIDGRAAASGNAGISLALIALSSGNAALGVSSTALASGNAALVVGTNALPKSGGSMTGAIVASGGTVSTPGIRVGTGGVYGSGQYFVGIAVSGIGKLAVTNEYVRVEDDNFQIEMSKTPASASASGTAGQIAWDTNYLYVCTATNTWKRTDLNTWV
jgi:hypothetical protein